MARIIKELPVAVELTIVNKIWAHKWCFFYDFDSTLFITSVVSAKKAFIPGCLSMSQYNANIIENGDSRKPSCR